MTGEPLRPGDVVTVPEEHYLYGTGPLKLRILELGDYTTLRLEWVSVRGVEVLWNGSDGPERKVMVRVAAIPSMPRG